MGAPMRISASLAIVVLIAISWVADPTFGAEVNPGPDNGSSSSPPTAAAGAMVPRAEACPAPSSLSAQDRMYVKLSCAATALTAYLDAQPKPKDESIAARAKTMFEAANQGWQFLSVLISAVVAVMGGILSTRKEKPRWLIIAGYICLVAGVSVLALIIVIQAEAIVTALAWVVIAASSAVAALSYALKTHHEIERAAKKDEENARKSEGSVQR
jgi:hypothetical protein